MRAPDGEPLRWKVDADVEALAWAPHAPTTFLVSTEDGLVCAYDARSGPGSAPLFRLSAHDAATSAMSFNPALPNLMATASTDMKVGPFNALTPAINMDSSPVSYIGAEMPVMPLLACSSIDNAVRHRHARSSCIMCVRGLRQAQICAEYTVAW